MAVRDDPGRHLSHPLLYLESEFRDSYVSFKGLPRRFTRDELALSEAEARQLIASDRGLPRALRFPVLEELIIRECNVQVGVLTSSRPSSAR